MTERLWRVGVTVPDERAADAIAELICLVADAVTAFETTPRGPWLVQGYVQGKPDRARIEAGLALAAGALHISEPTLHLEPQEEIDWLKRNQESFPPLRIGRYFVHGSHVEDPPPAGSIPLLIDAATAFGTGEHATTEGCLRALGLLARRGRRRRILDMGAGTGILAIAAAKTWHVKVLACDIDAHSVEVARENARLNGVAPLVACRASDGYGGPSVRAGAPYDLVFANILARPLARMAPDLARYLAPGGIAILSGLLASQEAYVAAAHRAAGLVLLGRIAIKGWHTLVLRRAGCMRFTVSGRFERLLGPIRRAFDDKQIGTRRPLGSTRRDRPAGGWAWTDSVFNALRRSPLVGADLEMTRDVVFDRPIAKQH